MAADQRRVELFAAALCDDCRPVFLGRLGSELRRHLRQTLCLVPPELDAFPRLCDECYRLVWDAIARARFGLLDDACHAWAISTAEKPVGLGLFIHLLFESEKLAYRDPRRRVELCHHAGDVAREIGNEDCVQMARIYEGNAVRAVCDFLEARKLFGQVETRACLWRLSPTPYPPRARRTRSRRLHSSSTSSVRPALSRKPSGSWPGRAGEPCRPPRLRRPS